MIYIFTHTDFKCTKKDSNRYTILTSRTLNNSYDMPIINCSSPLEYGLAEGTGIRHLYENKNILGDIVGINHYRRFFEIESLSGKQVILPNPIERDIRDQYGKCHNIDDIKKVESIIHELYPTYNTRSSHLYPFNMFIMKKEDFIEYCKFQFSVIDEFNRQNNIKCDNDILKYVTSNKDKYRKFVPTYQSRLLGFLMERIGTIFFNNYFRSSDIKLSNVIVTSNKICK